MNQDKLNRAAAAEVARDLDRYLARQDRADARAKEVERMATEIIESPEDYGGFVGRLWNSGTAHDVVDLLWQYGGTLEAWKEARQILYQAAHAYADENLEKLLEGQQ